MLYESTYMSAYIWELDLVLVFGIQLHLVLECSFALPAVDYQEEVKNCLLEEIYSSQLENVSSCFFEYSRNSDLLDTSVITDIISVLIDIFYDFQVRHQHSKAFLHSIA